MALIHGYCLGGGLELALACDYRVARDDMDTRLGFPEVCLGIFPGFGGTVRSIRAAGPLRALPLMLSGRAINGRQAKRMGLIDHAVPAQQLRNAARQLIATRPARIAQACCSGCPAPCHCARWSRPTCNMNCAKKVRPEHYPAPYALLRHWLRHAGSARGLYHSEAREVARLLTSDNAQQLIRVFLLQDRLKGMGDRKAFRPRHVHVVGGGIMGGDIAA